MGIRDIIRKQSFSQSGKRDPENEVAAVQAEVRKSLSLQLSLILTRPRHI